MTNSQPEKTTTRTGRKDYQLAAQLWPFLRPHWRPLALALLLIPLTALLSLLPPYLLKLAIDNAIVANKIGLLAPITLAFLGVALAEGIFAFGQSLTVQLAGQRACHDLRVAAHRHSIALNLPYFDRTPVGGLLSRITNDVESIAEAFAAGALALIGDVLKIAGIVGAMLWLNPQLTLVSLALLPLLALLVLSFQRLLRVSYRKGRKLLAQINATIQEQISGVRVIQIFSREQRAASRFDAENAAFRDTFNRAIAYDATLFSLVELLGSLTVAVIIWYGAFGGQASAAGGRGTITVGLVVAFVEYVRRLFEPLRDLSAKYAVLQQAFAAAERVFGLLATDAADCPPVALRAASVEPEAHKTAKAAAPQEKKAAAPPKKIAFEGVCFAYEGQPLLFDQLSLAVEPFQTVALVGPTGSGKSSIVRLITRLYEWQAGAIRLDGVDIRSLKKDELRRRIVVLSQDFYLFSGTVRDNITLGDPSISDQALHTAFRRVGLEGLIALDDEVGQRGGRLSMGQRQLVVFARALAREPELLVLDEATANVDPESEQIVQRGLNELLKGRTAIVIAHRLTTIDKADRVLVIHGGKIVQQGRPDELAAIEDGLFARLRRLQYV